MNSQGDVQSLLSSWSVLIVGNRDGMSRFTFVLLVAFWKGELGRKQ